MKLGTKPRMMPEMKLEAIMRGRSPTLRAIAAGVAHIILTLGLGFGLGTPAQATDFSFGVIGRPFVHNKNDASAESALHDALDESDADNLAFVVVNGIKTASEPCSDQLYLQRRGMLEDAQNGVIMALAANDWVSCKDKAGKSTAIERLNQIRELFYDSDMSFGASKLDLMRQSATPKFREYAENARWEFGEVLFATINLPANNNHYRSDGGRNGEYEDRLIANRDWLQRLFAIAKNKKLAGIVLISDADPLLPLLQRAPELRGQRDGFNEVRQLLNALSAKYAGHVLLVHNQRNATNAAKTSRGIAWLGNFGTLASDANWSKINVDPARPTLFSVADHKDPAQISRR
jgi:hypothetical protein